MSLPTPTLRTTRLRLRPFDDADADDLFAVHSSAYVLRYWDASPWREPVRRNGSFAPADRWPRRAPGCGWPWTVAPRKRSSDGAVSAGGARTTAVPR